MKQIKYTALIWAKLDETSEWIKYVDCGHSHSEEYKAAKCGLGAEKRLEKERPAYKFKSEVKGA